MALKDANRETLDVSPQRHKSWLVLREPSYDSGTCVPSPLRAWIDRCEDTEQMLNIHVLCHDLLDVSRIEFVEFEGSSNWEM